MAQTSDRAWDEDSEALFACAEHGGALCTVTAIEGSWSRRLGAQLAVLPDGTFRGSLADGCIESGLAAEAARGGPPRTLRLGAGSPYIDIRLPCGSGVDVVVDPAPDRAAVEDAAARLRDRKPASLPIPREDRAPFARLYIPALRLVALGSGPELEALDRLAGAAGIKCETARPLGEQGGSLSLGRAPGIALDRWTAVAVLFHDHEWESVLLPWALAGDAFYVGAQGGARARAQRREQLVAAGVSEDALGRLVSPIGVIGGARAPTPLGLSILTDIVFRYEALRRTGGGFRPQDVALALLAAGRSERFGAESKLLQDFGGEPLGLFTARTAAALPFAERFAVTAAGDTLPYETLGYERLHAPAGAEMAASLHAALLAARSRNVQALVVVLADMPFVDAAQLKQLLAASGGADGPPLFSRRPDGTLMPPAVIPARWFPALLEQQGDQGARALRAGAAAFDCAAETLIDIDTPEQLATARALLRASARSASVNPAGG